MFPQTEQLQSSTSESGTSAGTKSHLFDFSTGDFILQDGKVTFADDNRAVKVWVEKVLKTEMNRFKIYADTKYGTRIEDLLIGSNYPLEFIESELKREIEDALLAHSKITSIINFTVERDVSGLTAIFTVNLDDGSTIEGEVSG